MFFEKRFLKTIERIRTHVSVPLRIELWNGRQFDFCSEPSVTVTIPNRSALRYFMAPNLTKLGEAFVEGHIRVEGSAKNVFKVAEGLARSMTSRLPSAFHWAMVGTGVTLCGKVKRICMVATSPYYTS